jgi:hypothetical protein
MFDDINLHNPDIAVDCRLLTASVQVYDQLRSIGLEKMYAYGILYKKTPLMYDFIKIGQSCPNPGENTEKAVGERIKRQLEHVPGWNDPPHYSSHGMDFWMNVQREIVNKNLPNITKNSLTFAIWNLDARRNKVSVFTRKENDIPLWVEGELARQYKSMNFGKLPILNIQDPTKNDAYRSCNVSITHFNKNFSYK